jgi:hypothetical protein
MDGKRRRRLRLVVMLAMVATVASLGTARQLAGHARTIPPPVRPSGPELSALPPARQLWPAAVRALPPRLPDGRTGYRVLAALPGDRYLVGYPEPDPALAVFDTERATVNAVTPATFGDGYRPAGSPTVSGERVTWVVTGPGTDGRPAWEIWAGRIDGAAPRRVVRLAGADAMVVRRAWTVGDRVLWTGYPVDPGATWPTLYEVPLAGGTPAPVPGGGGYAIAYDTWAAPAGGGQLWNVVTGDHLETGVIRDADGRFTVRRPGGGDPVPAPAGTAALTLIGAGRFAVGTGTVAGRPACYLWDLSTGRLGALPFAAVPDGPDQTVLAGPGAPDRLTELVDLTLIRT